MSAFDSTISPSVSEKSTAETVLSATEGDSARSATSVTSTVSAAENTSSHRINHVSVSAKLTDMQFLREHPQFGSTSSGSGHHSTRAHRHPPLAHSHTHATDPHLSYRDKPAQEPLSHAPTEDELRQASQQLFGGRVIVPNAVVFQQKLALFRDLGVDNLLVVSDFDFTISKFKMVSGQRGASCHRVLEDCGLLSHDYHTQAQAIQRKYYPMEVDPQLDEESRIKFMIEWVEQAHALLQKSSLTKDIISEAVTLAFEEQRFALRAKFVDFLNVLKGNDVPLLVFSAGITDVVETVLRRTLQDDYENYDLTVISNKACFHPETQEICGFEPPVLHVFNKKASTFLGREFFQREDTKARENVLVIGDSLGDVTMAEGMGRSEPHIIRVGFLNDRLERLPQYAEVYDIIILDDPGFDVPINLVQSIADFAAAFTTTEESEEQAEEAEAMAAQI